MILILVNTLDLNKEVKEKNKIMLKYFTSNDDINTLEYIQYEHERIGRKDIRKQQQPSSVTQKFVGSI